jgi:D-serine deaminase-like pyridoxal phosphate-dependent protein
MMVALMATRISLNPLNPLNTLEALPTPALLLDLDVVERNLRSMAGRASSLGVVLRPHVKTHKCIELAERQRALGVSGITVSTLYEARVFADRGFKDITWAFPVILSRLGEVRELAARVTLRVVADSPEAVDALAGIVSPERPLHVWLKVDCGYHRAGVDPAAPESMRLAEKIAAAPGLLFDGLLSHSGHAYHGGSRLEIAAIAEEERSVMAGFAERLRGLGIAVPAVSVGSTPAMSVVESLEGVTEARPGNYVFFDFTQAVLGSCAVGDCGVTVLASVVSSRSGQSVVDAGALALSKDTGPSGVETMGEIFADYAAGALDAETRLVSLSQEHGIVSSRLPVGSRVRILPNHSCLTVACFDEYQVVRGGEVVDRWKIWRGRSPGRGGEEC